MTKKPTKTKEKAMDPLKYFENIKKARRTTSDVWLKQLYQTSEALLEKAFAIGQDAAIKKLVFTIDTLKKEKKLLEMGFDTFVYREDVETFIPKVDNKVGKVIELENYPREIPDKIIDQLIYLKKEKIFDMFSIVFTDYTGEVAKKVEKERRRKDPILFGHFLDKSSNKEPHERFYYIADWEDEYCDLTLQKMVEVMAKEEKKEIRHSVGMEKPTMENVKEYLSKLEVRERNRRETSFMINEKPNLFKRIKLWFKK